MKNLTKTEKLEKILRKYGMNFDDLRQLNESQIKAVETDYHSTYGKSISIMFDFLSRNRRKAVSRK